MSHGQAETDWCACCSYSTTAASYTLQVPSCVVLPLGAHPSVSEFLALHLELFPILGLELLDIAGVRSLTRIRNLCGIDRSQSECYLHGRVSVVWKGRLMRGHCHPHRDRDLP